MESGNEREYSETSENFLVTYIFQPIATVFLAVVLCAFQITMFIESILLSLLPLIGLIFLVYYLFFS